MSYNRNSYDDDNPYSGFFFTRIKQTVYKWWCIIYKPVYKLTHHGYWPPEKEPGYIPPQQDDSTTMAAQMANQIMQQSQNHINDMVSLELQSQSGYPTAQQTMYAAQNVQQPGAAQPTMHVAQPTEQPGAAQPTMHVAQPTEQHGVAQPTMHVAQPVEQHGVAQPTMHVAQPVEQPGAAQPTMHVAQPVEQPGAAQPTMHVAQPVEQPGAAQPTMHVAQSTAQPTEPDTSKPAPENGWDDSVDTSGMTDESVDLAKEIMARLAREAAEDEAKKQAEIDKARKVAAERARLDEIMRSNTVDISQYIEEGRAGQNKQSSRRG